MPLIQTSSEMAPRVGGDPSRPALPGRQLLQSAFQRRKTLSHLRLGDALIQERLITVVQRDAALAAQALERGRLLGEILVESGAVTAEVIRRVLVEQLGVPSVDLSRMKSDPDALEMIDAALARKYLVVPLYLDGARIAVAMENPLWWAALKDIETATGLGVDPAMAPRDALLAAVEEHYSGTALVVRAAVAAAAPTTLADVPDAISVAPMDARLRVMSARVLSIQEEERRHISRDLHDDVGQSLTALKFALHRLDPPLSEWGRSLHAECIGMAEAALDRVRQLASNLRPPQLDELGLEEALRWLVERQRAATGLAIKCHFNGLLARRVPPAIESACYRIAQEALSNVTRHAAASSILVAVEANAVTVTLTVRDDGKGMDPDAAIRGPGSGLGLIGMSERAALAGGELTVSGEQGQGTMVRATFPLGPAGAPS
jgi:signal transduction histidine kinase